MVRFPFESSALWRYVLCGISCFYTIVPHIVIEELKKTTITGDRPCFYEASFDINLVSWHLHAHEPLTEDQSALVEAAFDVDL